MRRVVVVALLVLVGGAWGAAPRQEPTLAQMVGQLLLVRMQGETPSAAFLERVRSGRVGGVVLFGDNIGPAGPKQLVASLQRAAHAGGRPPLLIAIDQEGGIVKRLAGAPTLAPSQMRSAAVAQGQGRATGRLLHGLGIDVDLAPVLDVAHGGFISSRTFSASPAVVAARGVAFAAGLASADVRATAKHFPGLGYARQNTDDWPVVVRATRTQLVADWQPFRLAAKRHVPLVMMSTAAYPGLGSSSPAAFARPVVDDLRALGFDGAVVTDALQTPAVNATRSTGAAAVAAIVAGADLALAAGPSPSRVDTEGAATAAYDALLAAARSGKLPHARLLAAYAHVLALKRA